MNETRTETYPTAIGPVELTSNWEALHLVFRRRCGGERFREKPIEVTVRQVPVEQMQSAPEGALLIMDATVIADADGIYAEVPDPSFCAGVILDWLWLALAKFCKPEGWEFLHAAAVADQQDVTLIAGASGSGKTTALLAMMDAGAQYLSDDAVLLDPKTGMVYAWTRDLHLLPSQMQERWPELIGETLDFNGKVRVSPQALGHDASIGGRLRRALALAGEGEGLELSHKGVGLEEAIGADVLAPFCPIEWWGAKPADLAERVAARALPACPPLAVCTPFSGKAWALGDWIASFLRLNIPGDAHLLWLCNSDDDEFWRALQEQAALLASSYPHIQLWRDTHRVGVKDRQVAYLWQQLRTRMPDGVELVMSLEDDVLPDAGAFEALLREWSRREGRDMVGVPVAHTYMLGEVTALAWVYETAGPTTDARFLIADGVAAREAMPRLGPAQVSGLSFSCAMVSRDLFDSATLAPGGDAYVAGGYDHQFCMDIAAKGALIVAHWGIGSVHLKQTGGGIQQVRLNAKAVLLVGTGPDPGDGTRYEVAGRVSPDELINRLGDAEYALFVSPAQAVTPAYVDALVDHLTWHPQVGSVWGYQRRSDGRMTPASGAGVLVRLQACRGARTGELDALRAWLCTEGWHEHHSDRACLDYLGSEEPVAYSPPRDRRRIVSPYRVLMLNRDRWRGTWPGFGGDFTQIEGYRKGLRALGVYADLRSGAFWWHDAYQIIHLHHHQYDWAWEAAETCDGWRPVVLSAITHGKPTRDIMGRAVGLADLIVCYSESEAAFIEHRFPEKKGRTRVVPMGVDSALFSANGKVEAERSVLMCGKICDYKNQLAVLEACKRLDVPVRFAGFNEDPIHDPYLDEFAAAVAAYPKAEFLGFLHGEDLRDAYDRAWVHANASRFGPFEQVSLDALARRCNVVHTQNSWAAEMFGKVGSLCDPDDVDSIAEAIDTELKRRRGWANCRPPTYVEAARSLMGVYEEALAR